LSMRQGRIIAAQGEVLWHDALITSPQQYPLGTIVAEVTTKSHEVRATIGDKDGPLQLEGLFVLPEDNSYTLTARLTSQQPELSSLLDSLAFLGKKEKDGWLHLSSRGELPPILF
jgi:hypothetical protein